MSEKFPQSSEPYSREQFFDPEIVLPDFNDGGIPMWRPEYDDSGSESIVNLVPPSPDVNTQSAPPEPPTPVKKPRKKPGYMDPNFVMPEPSRMMTGAEINQSIRDEEAKAEAARANQPEAAPKPKKPRKKPGYMDPNFVMPKPIMDMWYQDGDAPE